MDILQYTFMQKALVVGFFLALALPFVGTSVVLKKMSMLGDTLSHASLAGVVCGLVFGFNPLFSAVIMCVIASLAISIIQKQFRHNQEIALSILMSFAVSITAIASSFVETSTNFNSYLFGSIVAITDEEVYLVVGLSIITIITYIRYFKEIMYVSFDEEGARLAGVPVRFVNFLLTLLIAVVVAIAAKTVGVLVVSSLLVIPVASSIRISKGYKRMFITTIIISQISMLSGLIVSYYTGLKPGGVIGLISIAILLIIMVIKKDKG